MKVEVSENRPHYHDLFDVPILDQILGIQEVYEEQDKTLRSVTLSRKEWKMFKAEIGPGFLKLKTGCKHFNFFGIEIRYPGSRDMIDILKDLERTGADGNNAENVLIKRSIYAELKSKIKGS